MVRIPAVCPQRKPAVLPAVDVTAVPQSGLDGVTVPAPGAVWRFHRKAWLAVVAAYEIHPRNLVTSWHYLDGHPVFWTFCQGGASGLPASHVDRLVHNDGVRRGVDILVTSDGEVWGEIHPATLFDDTTSHDWDLDTGAATYEQVIVRLAWYMWMRYGNDRRILDRVPVAVS